MMKTAVILTFLMSAFAAAHAQETEKERMNRDLEVAESILSTMIKQGAGKRQIDIPFHVSGEYKNGKAQFNVPSNGMTRIIFSGGNFRRDFEENCPGNVTVFKLGENGDRPEKATEIRWSAHRMKQKAEKKKEKNDPREKGKGKDRSEDESDEPAQFKLLPNGFEAQFPQLLDSIDTRFDERLVAVAKTFIADYGDLLSFLKDNEKIAVTTRDNQNDHPVFLNKNQRYAAVEAKVSDVRQYKKGGITREQLMQRIVVSQGLMKEERKVDYELLQTIFNRLYRSDLSKTFFCRPIAYNEEDGQGITFRMKTYSSNRTNNGYDMPTLGKTNVSQAERDKLVKELYPKFEEDLTANILEYGRTLKSLKSNETLTFEVTYTQCKGCQIPESASYSIKMSDLSDYSSGKINLRKAMSRMVIKKGDNQ